MSYKVFYSNGDEKTIDPNHPEFEFITSKNTNIHHQTVTPFSGSTITKLNSKGDMILKLEPSYTVTNSGVKSIVRRGEARYSKVRSWIKNLSSQEDKQWVSKVHITHVEPVIVKPSMVDSALGKAMMIYKLGSYPKSFTVFSPIEYLQNQVHNMYELIVSKEQSYKISINFHAFFHQGSDREKMCDRYFKTKAIIIYTASPEEDIKMELSDAINTLSVEFDSFTSSGSGWVIYQILSSHVEFYDYQAFRGSSYIELPSIIGDKKATVNVKNKDERCFYYALTSALYPAKTNMNSPSTYEKYMKWMKPGSAEFPMPVCSSKYRRFEKMNNIGFNVIGFTCSANTVDFQLIYSSSFSTTDKEVINLLLIQESEINKKSKKITFEPKPEPKNHYVWLKSLGRLLSATSKTNHKVFPCVRCFQMYTTEEVLQRHLIGCRSLKPQVIRMPINEAQALAQSVDGKKFKANNSLEFKAYEKQMKKIACVYADFESILVPCKAGEGNTIKNNVHIPSSFCMKTVCIDSNHNSDTLSYRPESKEIRMKAAEEGRDFYEVGEEMVANKMWEFLHKEHARIVDLLSNPKPLIMSKKDESLFKIADECHICEKKFKIQDNPRWKRNNYKGEYVDAIHKNCRPVLQNASKCSFYKSDYSCVICKTSNFDVDAIAFDHETGNSLGYIHKKCRTGYKKKIFVENCKAFSSQELCTVCELELPPDYDCKVRDHCHILGNFRGAAHKSCNLQWRIKKPENYKLPVVFHNLKGYDSHLIIKSYRGKENLSCIPSNTEKYLSLSIDNFNFIDSYQFMPQSIEALVDNLKKDGIMKFKNCLAKFKNQKLTPAQQNLIIQKGVYPYTYSNSWDKFNKDHLPPIEKFYNDLSKEECTPKLYNHACEVWKEFQCVTFGDYHDLYQDMDVLLLADVFEGFRDLALANYRLDPLHYCTSPGMAWDAMLRMTGVKLELLTDVDDYQLFENSIRGGISMIGKRYAKANNKDMLDYDKTKKSTYITYDDANNLYGAAMMMDLPNGNFKKLSENEIKTFDLLSIPENNPTGYRLTCDIRIPEDKHDFFNEYPVCPERVVVTNDYLSDFSKIAQATLGVKEDKSQKLVPNLFDKIRYCVDYRYLQYCVKLGVEILKIHEIISYDQSAFLSPFIQLNTNLRTKCKNEFEKEFFKLMNNSVFGKTMENIRNRIVYKLVNNPKKFSRLTAKPSFKRATVITQDVLVGVEMDQDKIFLNKPVYVGATILDLSKLIMLEYHYDYIIKRYGDKATLLFTDTDSLAYEIETDDIFKDRQEDMHLFDFSDYPDNHRIFDFGADAEKTTAEWKAMNKKVVGKFKDELMGKIILEFVGLRPKMYSYHTEDTNDKKERCVCKQDCTCRNCKCKDEEINGGICKCTYQNVKKGKGIKKCVLKSNTKFACYKNTLFAMRDNCQRVKKESLIDPKNSKMLAEWIEKDENTPSNVGSSRLQMTSLRSFNHRVYTITANKIGLSAYDNKRFISDDGVNSCSYGHYRINTCDPFARILVV